MAIGERTPDHVADVAALVTGASTGIGRATARAMRDVGFTVFAGVRSAADAAAVETEGLRPLHLDVTAQANVEAAARCLEAERLCVLVNNAAIARAGPVERLDDDDLRAHLEVNLFGVHRVTRALLPGLLRARGRIVMVSSIAGRVGLPLFGAYAASKFALEGYSDTLRRELAPFGVHVAIVEPGRVATPMWDKLATGPPLDDFPGPHRPSVERLRSLAKRNGPARRDPAEVARAIVLAATSDRPRARYVVARRDRFLSRLAPSLPAPWADRLVERRTRG